MEDFTARLENIDTEELKKFLLSLKSPCYESDLLRIAFPGQEISLSDPLNLYRNHFLLYHLLFRLQDDFFKEGKYLFIHFMRTFITDIPAEGFCKFYNEHSGSFCLEACEEGKSNCRFHLDKTGETEIEELSERYFYLDKKNYYRLNDDTARSFVSGTWETLKYYDQYKRSFSLLGLPETADLPMIKRKFRILAKEYHPDGGGSSDKFKEINNAYRLLVRLRNVKWK